MLLLQHEISWNHRVFGLVYQGLLILFKIIFCVHLHQRAGVSYATSLAVEVIGSGVHGGGDLSVLLSLLSLVVGLVVLHHSVLLLEVPNLLDLPKVLDFQILLLQFHQLLHFR